MTGLSSTRCPTSFELGAALRVVTVLDAGGTRRAAASASYALIPTGGVYPQAYFAKGHTIIEGWDVLNKGGNIPVAASRLIANPRLPAHHGPPSLCVCKAHP